MSTSQASPFKRHRTRHRGVNYRKRADGSRTYYVYANGTYITVEGGEKEAVALQAELRARQAKGDEIVTPSKLLFSEIAERYWEAKSPRLRATTKKEYRRALDKRLLPRFGSRKIGTIVVDDVAGLIRDLDAQGLKPSTIQAYLTPLHGVMAYAVRKKLMSVNPCSQLTDDDRPHGPDDAAPAKMHEWSDAEMRNLVAAAESIARQPEARYDYAPLIKTALSTCLRQSELLGLTWRDVAWARDPKTRKYKGEINVRRQWTRERQYTLPKTRKGVRRVPIAHDLVTYLRDYKVRCKHSQDESPVFASKEGTPLQHRNTSARGFEPAAAKAGIECVSFHSMRHAYASRMIANGCTPAELAAVMGHASISITEKTYIHWFNRQQTDDRIREASSWTN